MENFQKEKKNLFYIISSTLVILAIFLGVLVVSGILDIKDKIQNTQNVITVSATSEVFAKPDLARTSFSVLTEAKTVAEALVENTARMNAVIDFIKKQGVEEKDLKTTNFYISPRYEWTGASEMYPSGKRILAGYEVSQSLEVKIRDLGKAGDLIQGATAAGANLVGDLQFSVENQDKLRNQARGEAIAEAKDKAKELASQLGVGLGKILNFSENGASPYFYASGEAKGMGGGEAVPQIETGENKIEVTVYITYQIY